MYVYKHVRNGSCHSGSVYSDRNATNLPESASCVYLRLMGAVWKTSQYVAVHRNNYCKASTRLTSIFYLYFGYHFN